MIRQVIPFIFNILICLCYALIVDFLTYRYPPISHDVSLGIKVTFGMVALFLSNLIVQILDFFLKNKKWVLLSFVIIIVFWLLPFRSISYRSLALMTTSNLLLFTYIIVIKKINHPSKDWDMYLILRYGLIETNGISQCLFIPKVIYMFVAISLIFVQIN